MSNAGIHGATPNHEILEILVAKLGVVFHNNDLKLVYDQNFMS